MLPHVTRKLGLMNFFGKIKVFTDYIGGSVGNNTYSTFSQTFGIRFEPPFVRNHCKTKKNTLNFKILLRHFAKTI